MRQIVNISCALLAAVSLIGCAAPVGKGHQTRNFGPTESEAAQNRAKSYVAGRAALDRYTAGHGDEAADRATVLRMIEDLQEQTSQFHAVRMYEYERQSRERHLDLAFGFADTALTKGDLEAADHVYRGLIAFYVGGTYDGIRDRAMLGLRDIRYAEVPTD